MKIFFDTEFIETGPTKPLHLLSIGLISETGTTYYAELDAPLHLANQWVQANVLPHLSGIHTDREQLAEDLIQFCGPKPEFWSWMAAYDWVCLAQVFGTMSDLPGGWPYWCHDLQQFAEDLGVPRKDFPEMHGTSHNALDDARWHRDVYHHLVAVERSVLGLTVAKKVRKLSRSRP